MLSMLEARALVVGQVAALRTPAEEVALDAAVGRVLAADVTADRDQPPFDRSTRDGFAVRAADRGARRVIGELAAGATFDREVMAGECVEIMTGAGLPAGADAVVMVEHVRREGDTITFDRDVATGENVVATGSEARHGAVVLSRGARVDPAVVGLLASVGRARVAVHARPRVAIVGTGDELVEVDEVPSRAQIRNSNSWSLAAQVARAGGVAVRMPIARDDQAALRAIVERALSEADILVLSGGVSMGKYDFVEGVLGALGAKLHFDAVAIRPGKPAVFGIVRGKPFFGLPGNPLSTTLTFELFARPAIELIGGAQAAPWRTTLARLATAYRSRPLPLMVFAPSRFTGDGSVEVLPSQGSGDLVALARADVWAIFAPDTTHAEAGALVEILPR